jgi:K+-sensing histidine kinase KdpD
MSDQMKAPVKSILQSVKTISQHGSELTDEDIDKMVDDIIQRGEKVTALLNQLIADAEKLEVKSE